MTTTTTTRHEPRTIGWREWLALPEFGLGCVRGKIDTRLRASWLHAVDVESFTAGGAPWLRFVVLPVPGDTRTRVRAEAPRALRRRESRPVIRTLLTLGDLTWSVELVLCGRGVPGYRLALGREALGRRFLVDPARSFTAGPPALRSRETS